ncbi:PilZ domain-containing protein [Psychromonas sp. 14N.309.X.WAT.B.A12]|uniref:PilZ domain-containing protein n=1 Tax=unclassified Psychromonas TaxID=2614957 RepID=UPI0025B28044|nr:PilZ domain-containing protein [Psychromonas sp. 14N.309.X.WAT.B.A12]MDN2662394.1 PilZ domain-containing protein [Psychromonas sp. 14N.309.X.WAT.B.A12]
MAKLHEELLINDQELDLLSEMLAETEKAENKELVYDISGKSGQESLLFQLGLADDLQLVANYGNHHLVFPVQMQMGDFSNFSMSLKSPKIFETGDQLRSWRLSNNTAMSIVNEKGEVLPYRVKDLSASGISLLIDDPESETLPKELSNIYLQLPDQERLAISGSQIRRIDQHTVAYSLGKEGDDNMLSSLTEYLFKCHAEQHPEAHINRFK